MKNTQSMCLSCVVILLPVVLVEVQQMATIGNGKYFTPLTVEPSEGHPICNDATDRTCLTSAIERDEFMTRKYIQSLDFGHFEYIVTFFGLLCSSYGIPFLIIINMAIFGLVAGMRYLLCV